MSFVFNKELAKKKQAAKFQEAEKRAQDIFSAHPTLASLDKEIKEKKLRIRGALILKLSPNEKKKLEEAISNLSHRYQAYLESNHISKDFAKPHWDCEKCQDRGEVLTIHGYKPCTCSQNVFFEIMQKESGLPSRFSGANFNNVRLDFYPNEPSNDRNSPRNRATRAYAAANKFISNWSGQGDWPGLIYDGAPGSGKTYILSCIANELMTRGIPVQYINYNDFLYQIKMSYSNNTPFSEYEITEKILRAPLLLIDDLGTEMATDFSSTMLFRIIDKRYAEQMPLVVSTSIPANELRARLGYLGEKITQRIIESCTHHILTGDVRQSVILRRLSKNE